MNVERETLIRFGVPIVATLVFVALVAVVGVLFGTTPSGDGTSTPAGVELSPNGAFALIGLLVVFVVGMAVIGGLVGGAE